MEHHEKTTNKYGLINIKIGTGDISLGNLLEMDWANGPYFIETAIDSTDLYNYTIISNTQLVSAPYALHAETVTNPDDADADPTNEIQNLEINGNELSIDNVNSVNLPTDGIWKINSDNIFYNTGFVGVGISSPQYPLHITNESVDHDGRNLIFLENLSTDNFATCALRLQAGNKNGSELSINHSSDTYYPSNGKHNISTIWNKGRGLRLRSTNSQESSILFETNVNQEFTERMRIDKDGNVGIGTTEPEHKLHIADGDIYLEDINSGIIMKSEDGQCWKIRVNNDGSLSTLSIECP